MRISLFSAAAAAALALSGAALVAPAAAQGNAPTRQIAGRVAPADLASLRTRAEGGDRNAQNDLGAALSHSEDPALQAEARTWLRRAAEAGDAEAKNNLAAMLTLGIGGPSDEAEARRLLEEAAREGSLGANMSIAERYLRGVGGYPRDPVRAFEHMSRAARSTNRAATFAQWRLAMMHLEGIGTPRDPAQAYLILVAASEAGGVRAMISRAVMLATGEGVAEDDAAARHWYQRAAESGEYGLEHALRGLGGMLVSGEGGPVDLPRGVAYLRLAHAAGDEPSERILTAIADRITPAVDREAQQIAQQWMRQHLPAD